MSSFEGGTIQLLRDLAEGAEIPAGRIGEAVGSVVSGEAGDLMTGALLMGLCTRDLPTHGVAELTEAMATGATLAPKTPSCGKHSTGGVGDCLTLVVVPTLAAMGLAVPKFSGTRLAHCGGTIERLRSFSGVNPVMTPVEMDRSLEQIGCFVSAIGSTFATGDAVLYGARRRTATVQSAALIASSVMSKKIAEGVSNVVIDMPVGPGGLVRDPGSAADLTEHLLSIGTSRDMRVSVCVRDASAPLSPFIGHSLEAEGAVAALRGEGPPEVQADALRLCAEALLMAGVEGDAEAALLSGAAYSRFIDLLERLGGGATTPIAATHRAEVHLADQGAEAWVARIDPLGLGRVVQEISEAIDDEIVPGVRLLTQVGARASDEPVAVVQSSAPISVDVVDQVRRCFTTSSSPPQPAPVVASDTYRNWEV